MSDLNAALASLTSFSQTLGQCAVIAGGISGIWYAGNALLKLWDRIENSHYGGGHTTGGSIAGLILAVVIGSTITIFSIIIALFSTLFG